MATNTSPETQRVSSLDGLRALAIASVVLYHLDVPWLPSGHMGVVIFLVLTGFLITGSALRALDGGAHGLLSLWRRRLGRIWPPMAVMVVVVTALCVLFNHILLTKLRPDIVPALLLYPNLSYILRGVSYFDQIGGPSPLTHLWYLGVDAQFCLVWPLVLAQLGRRGEHGGRTARRVALALAAVSALLMAILYNPDADPTRVYYGTDTRAFAPLLGAWLALAWPLGKDPAADVPAGLLSSETALKAAGAAALAALIAIMALVPAASPMLYRGGMLVVALLVVALLAALRVPGMLSTAFSAAPLRWLSSRSYGLYLWHFPLFQLLGVTNGSTPLWVTLCAVALSLAAAEMSWRAFDNGGLARAAASAPSITSPSVAVPAATVVLAAVVAGVGLAVVPEEVAVPREALTSTGAGAAEAMDLSGDQGLATEADADATNADREPVDLESLPSGSIVLSESAEAKAAGLYDPVMIGDSVPAASQDYFAQHCPDGLLDAYVGRRPDQMEVVLNDYLEQGIVGNVVILEAFSNNVPSAAELDRMVSACGPDRSVFLVTIRITQSVQDTINANLWACAERFGNVEIIDWYALSADNMDKLYDDGIHLRPEGVPVYVDMLTNAVKRSFAEGGGTVSAERPEGEKVAAEGTGTTEGV